MAGIDAAARRRFRKGESQHRADARRKSPSVGYLRARIQPRPIQLRFIELMERAGAISSANIIFRVRYYATRLIKRGWIRQLRQRSDNGPAPGFVIPITPVRNRMLCRTKEQAYAYVNLPSVGSYIYVCWRRR